MPLFTIGFPCKEVTNSIIPTFSTVAIGALTVDAEIIIGVQDIERSDRRSLEWLSEQPKTRLIHSHSAVNLSGNLNQIIKHSLGRYFVRTDDDDYMHISRMPALAELAREFPGAAIIGQAYRSFTKKGIGSLILPSEDSIRNKLSLLLGVPFGHPAITLDLEKVGQNPYDETQKYAQDYMLYVDMAFAGDYIGSKSFATYYNIGESLHAGKSEKRSRQLADHERAMHKMWSSITPFQLSHDEIHLIRSAFVTSEFSRKSNLSPTELQWCTATYKKAAQYALACLQSQYC